MNIFSKIKAFGISIMMTPLATINANTTNISQKNSLPEDFVLVTDIIPEVILEIRYYSSYNFVGERIDSYQAPVAILTKQATEKLKLVVEYLNKKGYTIKIFDAYRPLSAVKHFVRWAKETNNIKMKDFFYPDIDKKHLFDLGYIAEKSSHSRGSTLDITLVDMKSGKEIDAGSSFDFFGNISHHNTTLITEQQEKNRLILKHTMEKFGFESYYAEWWHYTLKDEPYCNTYFDFPIRQYALK